MGSVPSTCWDERKMAAQQFMRPIAWRMSGAAVPPAALASRSASSWLHRLLATVLCFPQALLQARIACPTAGLQFSPSCRQLSSAEQQYKGVAPRQLQPVACK